MNNKHIIAGRRRALRDGFRDGVPIGLGYLAVSFSLGIAAKNAGLNAFQSFIASMLCNASAGEYAGFTVIAANAAFIEMAVITLVANARYMLMSCSLSQRLHSDTPFIHRFIMGFYTTDELFGIAVAREGYLNPYYTYGAVLIASPCWGIGTALGTVAGNLLPVSIVKALSVALYGMFLAVIIPPARRNRIVAVIVAVCFAASYGASVLPGISQLSEGTRTIILTVVIAGAAAVLFPVKEEQ